MKSVLVVEDDPYVSNLLNIYLSSEAYGVDIAESFAAAEAFLLVRKPDLALVDLNLPDASGLDLVAKLRRETSAGIIIISGKDTDIDQIVGLEMGADDYVTKPFEPRHLLARIRSVARRCEQVRDQADAPKAGAPRSSPPQENEIAFGGWRLEPRSCRLFDADGTEFVLSAQEATLLKHLVSHAGQVLSRDDLMQAISGRDWAYMDRTIDILVARLRKKIEADTTRPRKIKTVRGAGYLFAREAVGGEFA